MSKTFKQATVGGVENTRISLRSASAVRRRVALSVCEDESSTHHRFERVQWGEDRLL